MKKWQAYDAGIVMRRAVLRLGDKSTSGGEVIEGIDSCTVDDIPVTFIGAKAWCHGCKTEGVIGERGPHQDTKIDGMQEALDGDICICKCSPPPSLIASQDGAWHEFTSHELAAAGYDSIAAAASGLGVLGIPISTADSFREEDVAPRPAPSGTHAGSADCSYLDGTKDRIDAPTSFYRHSNAVSVSPGRQTTTNFPGGGMSPATAYEATINGHPLDIYMPNRNPAAGSAVPDARQVAKALEAIPSQAYENLHAVSVNPAANPDDVFWQKQYNSPAFDSGATASIDKGIDFYPWNGWKTIPQQYIDSTMLHESGHLLSEAMWKDNALKQGWLDAVASDGQAPSQYARNNANEDFAESVNMYWSSKGTPCEAQGRKRYPARYRYFDSIAK